MKTISILFPIKESADGGVFKGTVSSDQALRSDMIALLTLKRGQRPMQSRMYSPIYDYIFEPLDAITQNELDRKIREKIKEFIPQVQIKKIEFDPNLEQNLLTIKIVYAIIDFFEIDEILILQIPTSL